MNERISGYTIEIGVYMWIFLCVWSELRIQMQMRELRGQRIANWDLKEVVSLSSVMDTNHLWEELGDVGTFSIWISLDMGFSFSFFHPLEYEFC